MASIKHYHIIQEAQLPLTSCATLRVIQYFAKALKVIRNVFYLAFLSYWASNNRITLKSRSPVTQCLWKW